MTREHVLAAEAGYLDIVPQLPWSSPQKFPQSPSALQSDHIADLLNGICKLKLEEQGQDIATISTPEAGKVRPKMAMSRAPVKKRRFAPETPKVLTSKASENEEDCGVEKVAKKSRKGMSKLHTPSSAVKARKTRPKISSSGAARKTIKQTSSFSIFDENVTTPVTRIPLSAKNLLLTPSTDPDPYALPLTPEVSTPGRKTGARKTASARTTRSRKSAGKTGSARQEKNVMKRLDLEAIGEGTPLVENEVNSNVSKNGIHSLVKNLDALEMEDSEMLHSHSVDASQTPVKVVKHFTKSVKSCRKNVKSKMESRGGGESTDTSRITRARTRKQELRGTSMKVDADLDFASLSAHPCEIIEEVDRDCDVWGKNEDLPPQFPKQQDSPLPTIHEVTHLSDLDLSVEVMRGDSDLENDPYNFEVPFTPVSERKTEKKPRKWSENPGKTHMKTEISRKSSMKMNSKEDFVPLKESHVKMATGILKGE